MPATYTTMSGVKIDHIATDMDRIFPTVAYESIPSGPMSGKTDLSPQYVRDRFDEVFGTLGWGWRIMPHPTLGRQDISSIEKTSQKGRAYTEFTVTMIAYTFEYCVTDGNGNTQWVTAGVFSSCDTNEDLNYAMRGAWSSLLKFVLRSFGGINHIYYGEYDHKQARRDEANPPNLVLVEKPGLTKEEGKNLVEYAKQAYAFTPDDVRAALGCSSAQWTKGTDAAIEAIDAYHGKRLNQLADAESKQTALNIPGVQKGYDPKTDAARI